MKVGSNVLPARHPSVGIRDRPGNDLALQIAAEVHPLKAAPSLVERLPHDRSARPERSANLDEVEPAELAHHEDRSLALGQIAKVFQQPPELLSRLRLLRQARPHLHGVVVQYLGCALLAPQFDRLVMGDAVKPRLQFDLPLLARQGPKRFDHRVLNGVLGVLGFAQKAEAKPIELLLIALEDCGDRPPIAPACAACQAIVGEKSKRHSVDQAIAPPGRHRLLRAWSVSLSLYAARRRSHRRTAGIGSKSFSIRLLVPA